jgi:hypothetical protein
MFKTKKAVIAAAIVTGAAIGSSARAGTSYAAFMFDALNSAGTPIIDGTYLLITDTDGDGLQAPKANTWLWDPQDLILDYGQIQNGEAFPFANFLGNRPAGVDASDNLYMLWFDVPFHAGRAGPGGGARYGMELLGVMDADPGDYTFFSLGGSATNIVPPAPPALTPRGPTQNSPVPAGGSLAGIGSVDEPYAALILAGSTSAATTVAQTWFDKQDPALAGTGFAAGFFGPDPRLISNIIDIEGLALGTKYVLQMTYADTEFGGNVQAEIQAIMDGWLQVVTLDTNGQWVPAINLNSDGGAGAQGFVPVIDQEWSDDMGLSHYGFNYQTNHAWVVLDHNSFFAVVPEPSSLALLAAPVLGLLFRRRRSA